MEPDRPRKLMQPETGPLPQQEGEDMPEAAFLQESDTEGEPGMEDSSRTDACQRMDVTGNNMCAVNEVDVVLEKITPNIRHLARARGF